MPPLLAVTGRPASLERPMMARGPRRGRLRRAAGLRSYEISPKTLPCQVRSSLGFCNSLEMAAPHPALTAMATSFRVHFNVRIHRLRVRIAGLGPPYSRAPPRGEVAAPSETRRGSRTTLSRAALGCPSCAPFWLVPSVRSSRGPVRAPAEATATRERRVIVLTCSARTP